MSTTDTQSPTDLEKFVQRHNEKLAIDAAVFNWHVSLLQATELKPPYDTTSRSVYCNQESIDEDGNSSVDEDATVKYLAKVIQFATSQGYSVEKKYSDEQFRAIITIIDNGKYDSTKVSYIANRDVVCTPKIIGKKFIPAYTSEARVVDDVEWECNKLSFLGIDTD